MVSTWTRPCGVGFTAHSGKISANSNIGNTAFVKKKAEIVGQAVRRCRKKYVTKRKVPILLFSYVYHICRCFQKNAHA
jgi:hypothetical protein